MRSRIYWGEVGHWRAGPKEHSFAYPIFTFALEIDELESLSLSPWIFAYGRTALFSVRAEDYLPENGTLRDKVEQALQREGVSEVPARITLLTMPRYFGYVFNPVSFFVCRDAHDQVTALVTQVNNTFGESHLYTLVCQATQSAHTWHFPKEFFVSPFFARKGDYSLTFEGADEQLGIRVDLEDNGEVVFSGRLSGLSYPLTRRRLLSTVLRYPITSLLTMPRIHGQAIRLYASAKAEIYDKPEPLNEYTFRSHQNLIHKARLGLLSLLKRCR